MKTAIYPGSFDPVTNGHLDIIQRASKMFDKLVVVVLINPLKTYSFSMKERCEFLKETTKDIPNVEIASFDGLLADYFNQRSDVDVIVKGLRATTDFEYEFQMAHTNKDLNPRAETVFIPASLKTTFVSSSISKYVPACIHEQIRSRLTQDFDAARELARTKYHEKSNSTERN